MGVLPVYDAHTQSAMLSPLKSKTGVPVNLADCIDRPRILALLNHALAAPVCGLIAPAGYGKTTALAQACRQLAQHGTRIAWLTLDRHDRDPARFAAGLVDALTLAGVEVGHLRVDDEASLAGRAGEQFIGALAERLHGSQPIVCVLDDVEHLCGTPAAGLLRALLALQPPSLRLALASRSRAPIDTATLSVRGVLREIGTAQLRFTVDEARDFLGADWPAAALAALLSQSDGWAAVLRLARLRGAPSPAASQEAAAARQPVQAEVFRYLASEVIDGMAAQLRRFLFMTAITPLVNAELACALSGREDAGALLAGLERDNLLVQRVDGRPGWFRYHTLLAQYLVEALTAREPATVASLHEIAADWLGSHDEPMAALEHSRHAPAPEFAYDLAERLGGWRLSLRHSLAVLRMLPAPLADPCRWPRVFLGQAYLLAQQGQVGEARELLDAAQARTAGFTQGRTPSEARHLAAELQMVGCILNIYEDLPVTREQVASLERLLADADRVEPEIRAILPNFLTFALFDSGDWQACIAEGFKAIRRNRFRQAAYAETYLHAYVGLAHFHLGELSAARAAFVQMEQQALARVGAQGNQSAIANVLLAAVDYAAGELSAATERLHPWLSIVEEGDGWFDLFQLGYEVEVGCALATGDLGRAIAIANRALQLAAARGQRRLQSWARLMQQWLAALLQGEGDALAGLRGRDIVSAAPACEGGLRWARIRALHARLRILGLLANDMPQRARQELRDYKRQSADNPLPALRVGIGILEAAVAAASGESQRARRLLALAQADAVRSGIIQTFNDVALGLTARIDAPPATGAPCTRAAQHPAALTPRETEILRQLNDGLSSKEIAARLGVAEGTVKIHRKNVYRKLDVARRSEAIARGRAMGLIG